MASSLAHELNQPLTAIANYAEAARDLLSKPDAESITTVHEALDEIAQQSLRAGQIVRRLRDFIARGETEKCLESLRILINEASTLALVGTRELGIEVMIDIDNSIHKVLVDRVQIQQVLVNLIRNAIDSMRNSKVKRLMVTAVPVADAMVEVSVTDNGAGVAEEVEDSLFKAFASTKSSGMGLGLSICQTIVEAHGGKIWYGKPENGGAAFHFTLQAAIPEIVDER